MNGSIVPEKSLKGTIKSEGTLHGSIVSEQKLVGKAHIAEGYDHYNGPYELIPQAFDEKRLETKGKALDNDIVMRKIPFYETSNLYGGITCYIGGEE